LFYLAGNTMSVVSTSLDAERPAGTPRVLFTFGGLRANSSNGYAVSPDGQRFLMIEGDRETRNTAVVILNWASGLARR
jgi:hypothetical protein